LGVSEASVSLSHRIEICPAHYGSLFASLRPVRLSSSLLLPRSSPSSLFFPPALLTTLLFIPNYQPSTLAFVYLGDVVTKKRNRRIDLSTKAVLLIKSWMGYPDAESWEMELGEKAEDVIANNSSVRGWESNEF
jgi:hypothetical protein